MLLSTLLSGFVKINPQQDCVVKGLTLDSRKTIENEAFIAISGTKAHGEQFIIDAISKGASVVLIDAAHQLQLSMQKDFPAVRFVSIPQLKQQLPLLAKRFYEDPSSQLNMIGVTGTNGKTSCTHYIAQCYAQRHQACGVIGTLGNGIYPTLYDVALTTPDVITLQKLLRDFVQQDAQTVAMEVSSHGIDQGRVSGVNFEIGVFTNLTQDHLDYHHTMENYANVKKRFLQTWPIKHLIINVDDEYGAKWLAEFKSHSSLFAYSIDPHKQDAIDAEHLIFAEAFEVNTTGIRAMIQSPWGRSEVNLALFGTFNLSNALATLATLCVANCPFEEAITLLEGLKPVPGRMQFLGGDSQPRIIVDYSHTPDSLEKALQTVKASCEGDVICVFGCGGDRDHAKRPLMGQIAERYADVVFITNDNPRNEAPEDIVAQILAGFSSPEEVTVELDRSKAILKSIQCAGPKDCVLLAGKGAEQYQQIGEQKVPFDDVEVAKKVLFTLT